MRVLDFDVQEGVPFLVLDYTPNGSLRQHHPYGTRLLLDQVVHYVKHVASALQYAHDRKIIHRDVKGANIMLTVAMDKITFHQPVFVGDLVSFWTETIRIGNTSITVKVVVDVFRGNGSAQKLLVTEAQVVYVNVGEDRKPAPIRRAG